MYLLICEFNLLINYFLCFVKHILNIQKHPLNLSLVSYSLFFFNYLPNTSLSLWYLSLPVSSISLWSSSHSSLTVFSSSSTFSVPLHFWRTSRASVILPCFINHLGLSGRNKNPTNWTADGTAASPSIHLST